MNIYNNYVTITVPDLLCGYCAEIDKPVQQLMC